jgi:mannose/fructose/N-acetylgalactosamine-specific phosphotransferase system component IIC
MTQLGWAAQFFDATKGGTRLWIFLGFEALFLTISFSSIAVRSMIKRINQDSRNAGEDRRELDGRGRVVAGFTALGFSFWISAVPTLARQPLFFFGFTFLADAGLLALPVIGRAHRGIALGAGGLTFILVAEWIGLFARIAPLNLRWQRS